METPHHSIGLPSIFVDSDMEDLLSKVRQHTDESIFFEDYVIKKRLYGGMGEVIICEDPKGRQMALKSFQKQFYFDYKIRLLFYNEIKTWSRLSGLPHIMPLLGLKEIDKRLFVIMPVIDTEKKGSGTLRKILDRNESNTEELLLFVFQIIQGLAIANTHYTNVVHGDLKPENILIQNRNLFISDFGLSKVKNFTDKGLITDTTWAYKAPELWNHEGNITIQSDIYALGILMYECVFGQLSIGAKTSEEFRVFHKEHALSYTESPAAGEAVIKLIQWCTDKNPERRPKNYQEIIDHFLNNIALTFPALFIDIFDQMHKVSTTTKTFQALIKPEVARALKGIGEFQAALEEIESVDEKYLGKYELGLYANLLSLNNQDEKALVIFDRAIALFEEETEILSLQSDKALSYKRLKRFDEAKSVYKDLINKAPATNKTLLLNIYSNFATTYMESGEFPVAIQLLRTLIIKHQINEAIVYANMGICYGQLQERGLAIEHFSRALQIDPKPEYQTFMARELIHLLRIEEAAELLELAFDQGYESRQWIVSMMTCLLLKNDKENLSGMIYGIRQNLGEKHLQRFFEESEQLIAEIRKNHEKKVAEQAPVPKPEPIVDGPKIVISDRQVTDQKFSGKKMVNFPFLNFRVYDDSKTFSIDYYDYLKSNFMIFFFSKIYEMDVARTKIGEQNTLSTHKFYITVCPTCSSEILTNRKLNKEINCRACNTGFLTTEASDPRFDEIINEVHDYLGRSYHKDDQTVMAFYIIMRKEYDKVYLEKTCKLRSYNKLDPNDDVFDACLFYLTSSKPNLGYHEILVFVKDYNGIDYLMTRDTPSDVSELIGAITQHYPRLESYSMSLPREHIDAFVRESHERYQTFKNNPYKKPDDYVYVLEFATRKGFLEDFNLFTDRFLLDYPQNFNALFYSAMKAYKSSDIGKAIELFQKTFKIDPTDLRSAMYLYHCYSGLGDSENSRKYLAILQRSGFLL